MINRRGLITGLISFVAAPNIVKATNIMHITVPKFEILPPGEYVVTLDRIMFQRDKLILEYVKHNALMKHMVTVNMKVDLT